MELLDRKLPVIDYSFKEGSILTVITDYELTMFAMTAEYRKSVNDLQTNYGYDALTLHLGKEFRSVLYELDGFFWNIARTEYYERIDMYKKVRKYQTLVLSTLNYVRLRDSTH